MDTYCSDCSYWEWNIVHDIGGSALTVRQGYIPTDDNVFSQFYGDHCWTNDASTLIAMVYVYDVN